MSPYKDKTSLQIQGNMAVNDISLRVLFQGLSSVLRVSKEEAKGGGGVEIKIL